MKGKGDLNPGWTDIKRKGESYQSMSLQTSNKYNEAHWEGKEDKIATRSTENYEKTAAVLPFPNYFDGK